MKNIFCVFFTCIILFSCKEKVEKFKSTYSADLKELTDTEYPDNPDILLRHPNYDKVHYQKIQFQQLKDDKWNIVIHPLNHTDTIALSSISFTEFMPTINKHIKKDEYLSYIGVVNQEWNRQQVQFLEGDFQIKGENEFKIARVDIARNCLNAYLWEIILYSGNGSQLYHGWFNFPKDFYALLFKKANYKSFDKYRKPLENWIIPTNKVIDLKKIRQVLKERVVTFKNINNSNYPLKGEQLKKHKNIVYPKNTTKIQDFLTDKSRFATFSPPGFYDTKIHRKTELSRLANPIKCNYRELKDSLFELELEYKHSNIAKNMKLYISGLNPNSLPTLDTSDVNDGWQNSMGFGNHTFYDTYANTLKHPTKSSRYFSILTDYQNNWLDSHEIGIDGPLLHWDIERKGFLHLWILSFERHCFVGHYLIDTNKN